MAKFRNGYEINYRDKADIITISKLGPITNERLKIIHFLVKMD